MKFIILLCAALVGLPASAGVLHQPTTGGNVSEWNYWDGVFAFADVTREAQFRDFTWGVNVNPDANGYPQQDSILIWSSKKQAAGVYKLSFDGVAKVAQAGGTIANQVYDPATNHTTADVVLPVDVTGNIWMTFTGTRRSSASSTADGVTNVHLYRPGYPTDGSVVFTKEYIQALQTFRVLRFMDTIATNGNASINWSDRMLPTYAGQQGAVGAPWEWIVALGNATGRDIWINVPGQASDDYVTKLAQLVRYGSDGVNPYTSFQAHPVYPGLTPGQRVYVEYGNEVWNSGSGFHCFRWALAAANIAMKDLSHPINYDQAVPITDQYFALRRWIAWRSSAVSLLFRAVWGDAAIGAAVRPVFEAQAGNANRYYSAGLVWAEGFYGAVRPNNPVARQVKDIWYGGGGSAYQDSASNPIDTLPATMDAYFAALPAPAFATTIATDATWSRAYGLVPVAYEGGPGPGGSSLGAITATVALANTYNNDPRMGPAMLNAWSVYLANGGDTLVYYGYGVSAPWTFVNNITLNTVADTATVKMLALTQINNGLIGPIPTTPLGPAAPATLALVDPAVTLQNVTNSVVATQGMYFIAKPVTANSGQVLVPFRALPGAHTVSIEPTPNPVGGALELQVDGAVVGTWTIAAGALPTTTPLTVVFPASNIALPPALHVLRIRALTGSTIVKNLTIN